MQTSTVSTNGVHHPSDEAIDSLYSFWPGTAPAPQPCPEAVFSLTIRGKLDGQETLLTVRGQSAAEFKRNLETVRGLLDTPTAPQPAAPASQGPGQGPVCPVHHRPMKASTKRSGHFYCTARTDTGDYCRERG
jgi:hypothetical protein